MSLEDLQNEDLSLREEMSLTQGEKMAALACARRSLMDYAILTQKNYIPSWHHEVIARKLEDVEKGLCKKLMIFVPPRHGKSELASIKFPAWYLGRHPDREVVCCSHTADLAEDFGRKTRLVVGSELHESIFPKCQLRSGSKKVSDWKVSDRGGFMAVGIRGSLTGRGANLLIIDDPVKDREEAESEGIRKKNYEWYTSTALTRLEKDAAQIIILTRWHDEDLAGKILQVDGEKGWQWDAKANKWIHERGNQWTKNGQWEVIRLPAIATEDEQYRKVGEALWEEKYNKEALQGIKSSISIRDWGALYQQDPVTEEGAEFKATWFKTWDKLPGKLNYVTTVDLAISQRETADDSVVMTCGVDAQDNIYVVEYKNWKASPTEVIEEIYEHTQKYNSLVGVESVGYQQALLHYIQLEGRKRRKYLAVEPIKTKGNKEEKIRGLIPYYANGLIWHAKNSMGELEDQLRRFPSGKHDDIIDALAMSLGLLRRPTRGATSIGGKSEASTLGITYTKDGKPCFGKKR